MVTTQPTAVFCISTPRIPSQRGEQYTHICLLFSLSSLHFLAFLPFTTTQMHHEDVNLKENRLGHDSYYVWLYPRIKRMSMLGLYIMTRHDIM